MARRAALQPCSLESILLKISLPQLTTRQESKTEPVRQGRALLLYLGREEAAHGESGGSCGTTGGGMDTAGGDWPQALTLQLLCSLVACPTSSGMKAQRFCPLLFWHPKLGHPGCREAAGPRLSPASLHQAGCWGEWDCRARANWVKAGSCVLSPAQMSPLGIPAGCSGVCEYPAFLPAYNTMFYAHG